MGVPILSSLAYVILLDSNYMKVTSEMIFTAVVRIWEGKKKKGGGGRKGGRKIPAHYSDRARKCLPFLKLCHHFY